MKDKSSFTATYSADAAFPVEGVALATLKLNDVVIIKYLSLNSAVIK